MDLSGMPQDPAQMEQLARVQHPATFPHARSLPSSHRLIGASALATALPFLLLSGVLAFCCYAPRPLPA